MKQLKASIFVHLIVLLQKNVIECNPINGMCICYSSGSDTSSVQCTSFSVYVYATAGQILKINGQLLILILSQTFLKNEKIMLIFFIIIKPFHRICWPLIQVF